jgi:PAS domain S-box-containing protein
MRVDETTESRPDGASSKRAASRWVLDSSEALTELRQLVTTALLGVLVAVGVFAMLVFAPSLIEAGSFGILAFGALLVSLSLAMMRARRLPLAWRAGWAVVNLVVAGVPGMFASGDRGVIASYLCGAVCVASLLLGWRAAAMTLGVVTVAFAGTVWGYATHRLPAPSFVSTDWNSPLGWFGFWTVLAVVVVAVSVATEMLFRQVLRLLAARAEAIAEKERAIATILSERERHSVLQTEVDLARLERASLERRFTETLQEVDTGYWDLELATGETRWSDAMYRLFGYEKGSVTPSNDLWRERTHPEDYARMMSAPPEERVRQDYRILLPGGRTRWVRLAMKTEFGPDGAPLRLRGLLTDITSERETARQLERLAEVASRTENGVVVTDLDGRIEWINDGFVRLTGWTLEEVRGKRPGEFLQGPQTDPVTRAALGRAIAAREPFECELLNYAKDGRQYWVHIEARVARDERGEPTGYIAIESDITARRLASQRDGLARRVAALLFASDSVEQMGASLVRELVGELDIQTAQLWRVAPGRAALVYVAGAASEGIGAPGEAFLDATRSLEFVAGEEPVKGVGIPGVAWGTRRSFVQAHITRASSRWPSRRLEAAQAAGLQTFCGTPILGPDGVLGVLEIGGTAFYPGHEQIPSLLERLAEQVASFLLHDTSRRAFESVFEHSPDGMLLVGRDGVIRASNARAAAMFGALRGRNLGALLEDGVPLVAAMFGPDEPASRSGVLVTREAQGAAGPFIAELSLAVVPSAAVETVVLSVRDLTERHRLEEALTRSLREKETLLKEVHHRVKNNLQIVSSLLSLQSGSIAEPAARSALGESVHRVRAMSFVHQQLYGTHDFDRVDLSEYARTLCVSLQQSLDPNAGLNFVFERVEVGIEQAIPCGLILNELLTNALKHGRDADGRCALTITIGPSDGGVLLSVSDAGPGFQGKPSQTSLGMQLIRSLTRQLRAKLEIAPGPGARVTLRIPPKEEGEPRASVPSVS